MFKIFPLISEREEGRGREREKQNRNIDWLKKVEGGREGRKERGKERERKQTLIGCLPYTPCLGIEPFGVWDNVPTN